jgi:hypothetical protein
MVWGESVGADRKWSARHAGAANEMTPQSLQASPISKLADLARQPMGGVEGGPAGGQPRESPFAIGAPGCMHW